MSFFKVHYTLRCGLACKQTVATAQDAETLRQRLERVKDVTSCRIESPRGGMVEVLRG